MDDRVRRIYDDLAPAWDRRVGATERLLMGDDLRRDLGRRLYGDVLEIGAGTGATLRFIDRDRIGSYTATDPSAGMLAQILPDAAPNLTIRQIPAAPLPFPDATFDCVTCSLVLCTVPDPAAAIREMARVCKPDGLVLLLEHVKARNPFIGWVQKKLSPMQERMLGCHLDRTTDRLVRELGFHSTHERRRFFQVFVLTVFSPGNRPDTGGDAMSA
jgi:ubiquinone/menaquinone biosynthesis C-methylase UbiE